jgi:hypothetical protein
MSSTRRCPGAQHHRVLEVATGALHCLGDELRIQTQLRRHVVPEHAHGRGIVVGKARRVVEIDLHQHAARRERVDVRVTRPAGAQDAHAGRQCVRQERRERIAERRSRPWVVLVEAIDQQHQSLAARHQRALGHALKRRRQPCRRGQPRVGLRFARVGEPRVDLRHQ